MNLRARYAIVGAALLVACMGQQEATPVEREQVAFDEAADTARDSWYEYALLEHIDPAKFESGWDSVSKNAPTASGTAILNLDFEKAKTATFGWPGKNAKIGPRKGRSRALRVQPSKGIPPAFIVPVDPGALIRVAALRSGPADGVQLRVLELSLPIRDPSTFHRADRSKVLGRFKVAGTHVNLAHLLKQHDLGGDGNGDWSEGRAEVLTTPDTRSLLLLFDNEAQAPAWFDDLRVEVLEPTPEQRLEIVKRRYGLFADSQLPKAMGQFLALPAEGEKDPAKDENFRFCRSLLVPPPASLRWSVRPPEGATLTFDVGLLLESAPGSRAKVSVTVGGEVLKEQEIGNTWSTVELGLTQTEPEIELGMVLSGDPGAVAVLCNPRLSRPRDGQAPPDVYLFAVDTLRADRMSTFGYGRPTSPNLDKLAKDGVVFENALAQSNWTPESFAGLFSGAFAGRHGVIERLSVLPKNEFADAFRAAGYLTHGIAFKLLLYDMGFERGFDTYYNRPKFHLSSGYDVFAEKNWKRGKRWIENHATRQKLLFFHLNDPHQPFNQRGESRGLFSKRENSAKAGLPMLIKGHGVQVGSNSRRCGDCVEKKAFAPWFVEHARDLYDEEVHYTDAHLGMFIQLLRDKGLYDDALIVFVADHGELLAEHRDVIGHGNDRMYQELLHVPLVIKPPKSAGIGARRVSERVRLVDVLPTVLELAGVKSSAVLEGRSLVPAMKTGELEDLPVVSENVHSHIVVTIKGNNKLTLNYRREKPVERYVDLAADPKERRPLPTRGGDKKLADLRALAASHVAETGSGAFILLRGKGPKEIVLRCAGSVEVKTLIGAAKKKKGTHVLAMNDAGEIRGAFKVDGAGATACSVSSRGKDRKLPAISAWPGFADSKYVELFGELESMLVFNSVGSREKKAGDVSGDQLEALRALGYVE